MQNRKINKIAVIGSGIMGSGIACHFANIGVEVLLLDIVPKKLNDKECKCCEKKQKEIRELKKQIEKLEKKLKNELETSLMMYHSP